MYRNQGNNNDVSVQIGKSIGSKESNSYQFIQDPNLFPMGKVEPVQSDELAKVAGNVLLPNVKTNFLKTSSLAQYR